MKPEKHTRKVITVSLASLLMLAVFVMTGPSIKQAFGQDTGPCPLVDAQGNCTGSTPPNPEDLQAQDIADLNNQIEDKRKEIEQISTQADQYKQQISQYQDQVQGIQSQISLINNEIALLDLDIKSKQTEIEKHDLQITQLQHEIRRQVRSNRFFTRSAG